MARRESQQSATAKKEAVENAQTSDEGFRQHERTIKKENTPKVSILRLLFFSHALAAYPTAT
jgi:hypothetical protein